MTSLPQGVRIQYGMPDFDVDYDVRPGFTALPAIHLNVDGVVYFADSCGYVMSWDGERISVDMPELNEKGEVTGTYTHTVFITENVFWSDSTEFNGVVPEEVIQANRDIAYALSVLHGIDRNAVDEAYNLESGIMPDMPDEF